ncbi:TetR/AcrR family transcriptional regulator [Paractinoplanes brasiliensis]|uniref:TetR family transcriptional regulator n=1 Tax=Paractinoplanes brasiliensis TaxID=52695 RepID=A0A4R6JNW9_9ACTN|nr:TetR/AcrR family transcriptional regulator [Actinoplanes brasiliensis]TDO37462.1 TetR family transcriptional regulator [Actinoplanes brasiliensis]GID29219.1 TetR family transcriptional regulator [Actinoplanes brasiliensis]
MPAAARRNEQSRRAILDATLALLAETDYAKVTIEAIAARAGVGKQTIYRWWRRKGEVVLEALAEQAMPMALPDSGDLEADLRQVVRATVAEFGDPRLSATTRALTVEMLTDDDLAEQVRDRLLRPQLHAVRDRLAAAREQGQIRTGADLDLAVELMFGPVFHRWQLRNGPLDAEYADALADHVLAALRP